MEYIGLLIEIIILVFAIYLYLFSRGQFKSKDLKAQARADKFRQENGTWLRILALALMAIMFVNVALHIRDLMA